MFYQIIENLVENSVYWLRSEKELNKGFRPAINVRIAIRSGVNGRLWNPGAGGAGQGTNSFNAGGAFPHSSTLYSNPTKMAGYDIVMLSCEGSQYPDTKLPYVNNMLGYMNAGGRLFLSHLHFYWLRSGPAPLPTTATYIMKEDIDKVSATEQSKSTRDENVKVVGLGYENFAVGMPRASPRIWASTVSSPGPIDEAPVSTTSVPSGRTST